MHWRKVSRGERGSGLSSFVAFLRTLPDGTLWRHNQAGDLPGDGDKIDGRALRMLSQANRGRRGFTYTHKPPTASNLRAIRRAVNDGFAINLSANDIAHADRLRRTGLPVVVVLPASVDGNATKSLQTPEGNTVTVCPATYRETTCADCGLCQRTNRRAIVGFPAHGSAKRMASRIAEGS